MSIAVASPKPDFLVKNQDNAISFTIYEDGAVKAPSAGTLAVKDGTGATISSPTVSILASVATATVPAADTASAALASNWTEEWTLTIDGVARTFRRPAILCFVEPFAPITEPDLEAAHSDLTRATMLPSGRTSWQDYIDEAWYDTIAKLMGTPFGPHAIVDWFRLRPYMLAAALERVTRDLMAVEGGNGKWTLLHEQYMQRVMDEWDALGFRVDRDGDGQIDENDELLSRAGVSDAAPGGRVW